MGLPVMKTYIRLIPEISSDKKLLSRDRHSKDRGWSCVQIRTEVDHVDSCFIALGAEAFAPTESGRVFAVWNTASLGLVEAVQLLARHVSEW